MVIGLARVNALDQHTWRIIGNMCLPRFSLSFPRSPSRMSVIRTILKEFRMRFTYNIQQSSTYILPFKRQENSVDKFWTDKDFPG